MRNLRVRTCAGPTRAATLVAAGGRTISSARWAGSDHVMAQAFNEDEPDNARTEFQIFDLDGAFVRSLVLQDAAPDLPAAACATQQGIILSDPDANALHFESATGDALATTSPTDPGAPDWLQGSPRCHPSGVEAVDDDDVRWLWDGHAWSRLGVDIDCASVDCSVVWRQRADGTWWQVAEKVEVLDDAHRRFSVELADAEGRSVWESSFNGSAFSNATVRAIDFATNGDLIIRLSGFSKNPGLHVWFEGHPPANGVALLVRLGADSGAVVFEQYLELPMGPSYPGSQYLSPAPGGLGGMWADECNGSLHNFGFVTHRLDASGAPAQIEP